jgi:hypothetical protein
MMMLRTAFAGLFIVLSSLANAQDRAERVLHWNTPAGSPEGTAKGEAVASRTPATVGTAWPTEPFTGAFIDRERGGLPFYHEIRALSTQVTGFTAHLRDARYAPLTAAERAAWPTLDTIGAEPEVHTHLGYYRKVPQAIIDVVPFRRNPATGALEKLVSFRLDLVETRGGGGGVPKSYPANSKLAVGEWFKFSVVKDGVYRLSYEFLQSLGVPMSGLASDRINIYGGHHGMIPFRNSEHPPTDLILNAIQVDDGGDGVFGPGDQILFYASGPHRWNLVNGNFVHTKHMYSDSAHYFVGLDVDPPRRIAPVALSSDAPTHTVTSFDDRQFIERDLVNLIKSGRTWYGETFDLITSYNFLFETPYLVAGEDARLVFDGAARTINAGGVTSYSSFRITAGGVLDETFQVAGVSGAYNVPYASSFTKVYTLQPSGNSLPVAITFNKFDPVTSVGWLNYLELNCRRSLRMVGDQLMFRDLRSVGTGNIAEFVLEQSPNAHRVWEITDPTNVGEVALTVNGQQRSFRVATDSLRQFIAFRDGGYLAPVKVGRVANQDLHATPTPVDLVVVCPPEFQSATMPLVEQRMSEGMSVVMVSPQQIYNEFSSGTRDAAAIKRYMRMLYDRAGNDPLLMPRHLLLVGDGSYNTFSSHPSNQNWIPSYQTVNSLNPSASYTSDDYFGFLDPNEGESSQDLVDIGIGRLPVSSPTMAAQVVSKLLGYDRLQLLRATGDVCSTTGDGGLADWRTHVLFVSDDQNGDNIEGIIHMRDSDTLARRVEMRHPCFNVDKIYLDAYQQMSTPGGQRYPQATLDLKEKVQKGALLVNYVGHGGEVGWAHERLLDNSTIMGWTNKDRLPLFMTATCEFSRWDDPGRTSAGEYVLLNPNGGGVALMTTTRLAYASDNFNLGKQFYEYVLQAEDDLGRTQQLGDIYRRTKRAITAISGNGVNHCNFSLLGDPSQRLAMPRIQARITSITDTLGNPVDTLMALSTVRISGFIDDGSGQPMSGFNGLVIPTVYDKALQQNALMNDPGPNAAPFQFFIRKNIIYRGKATVTNGQFSFTFVVPKDINYQFGAGRISCYAESWDVNACGYDNTPIVGGTATDVAMDEQGPRIELFMNDENFVRGGITNESPLLFAKLFDENGINTVGSSIGHDLLATLDANTEQAIVLNDLYEADLDTYKSGQVRYRFDKLSEGGHTLHLKAWDVFNNSSEASTEFVVAPSAELALEHVLNYPNPFTTYTEFHFEHNRPCTTLDVQVQVFTVSGRLVKTLNRQVACTGFKGEPMAWDGRDEYGDKIGRGVYVYRLSVATPEGDRAEKFEKLVILR